MCEAPKKIYLNYWLDKWYTDKRKEGDTAYIRADLVDGMREALELSIKNLVYHLGSCPLDTTDWARPGGCDGICDNYEGIHEKCWKAYIMQAALEEMKDE